MNLPRFHSEENKHKNVCLALFFFTIDQTYATVNTSIQATSTKHKALQVKAWIINLCTKHSCKHGSNEEA
jgi:hypothetical protein